MTSQFTVFSVFTTRASGMRAGSARRGCRSSRRTGRAACPASGRADSRRRRAPSRRGPPCAPSRSPRSEASPAVQLKTTSPWAAASANVPWSACPCRRDPLRRLFVVRSARAHHHLVAQLDELRADRAPTMPVPSTPILSVLLCSPTTSGLACARRQATGRGRRGGSFFTYRAQRRSSRRSPRSCSYRPPLRRTRASTSRRSSTTTAPGNALLVADAGQGIVNGDTGALVAPLLGVTDVAVRSGGGLATTGAGEDPEEDTGQGIWRISRQRHARCEPVRVRGEGQSASSDGRLEPVRRRGRRWREGTRRRRGRQQHPPRRGRQLAEQRRGESREARRDASERARLDGEREGDLRVPGAAGHLRAATDDPRPARGDERRRRP